MSERYRDLLDELLIDIDNYPDNECLRLSAEAEKHYILSQAQRVGHTIQYLGRVFMNKDYKKEECTILDIGTTPFTFLLKDYFGSSVYTIDLTSLLQRRCKLRGVVFGKCNLIEEDIPFTEKQFDIIIFTEVFEHLFCPSRLIFRRIRKVLKDDGILIFSTPNIASYDKRKRLLLGKPIFTPIHTFFGEETEGGWTDKSSHWREFTMEELKELLLRYEFKVIKAEHIINPYVDNATMRPVKWVKGLCLRMVAHEIPSLRRYNLIMAQKK